LLSVSVSGCGYKKNPYYQKKAPTSDKNIEFILEKKDISGAQKDESCE